MYICEDFCSANLFKIREQLTPHLNTKIKKEILITIFNEYSNEMNANQ